MDRLGKFGFGADPAAQPNAIPDNVAAQRFGTELVGTLQSIVDDLRAEINQAFEIVGARLNSLEEKYGKNFGNSVPGSVRFAYEIVNDGRAWTGDALARKVVERYLINVVSTAYDERSGRAAADDDASRQGDVQAQVQSDELGVEAEAQTSDARDPRSP